MVRMGENEESTEGRNGAVSKLGDNELVEEFESLVVFKYQEQEIGQVTPHERERLVAARQEILERMQE